jgi:hypothetical protein
MCLRLCTCSPIPLPAPTSRGAGMCCQGMCCAAVQLWVQSLGLLTLWVCAPQFGARVELRQQPHAHD